MKNYIFNHTSFETARKVDGYPYGRLRTSIFYWIETKPKLGDRFVSCTINPKNGRVNAPKPGTYNSLAVMYIEEGTGYTRFVACSPYSKREEVEKFVNEVGLHNLNPEQVKRYNELMGVVIKPKDKITGDELKDYSHKWERTGNVYHELRITFDRIDGVKRSEIFEAIKSVDQEKVKLLFADRDENERQGFVRVCVRGGRMLGVVHKDTYYEYLAQTVGEDKETEKANW